VSLSWRVWAWNVGFGILGGIAVAVAGAPDEVWTYCRVASPYLVTACVVVEQLTP
jgi:hypothetical protein